MVHSATTVTKAIDVARFEAKANGLRFYESGRQCPRGHTSTVRYTVSGKCLECSKTEGVRYQKTRLAYSADHSADAVRRAKAWKETNPERKRQLNAEYRERHRAVLRAKNVLYRKTHLTPLLDRRVRESRRRSRKADAGGSFTKSDIRMLVMLQRGKCAYCKALLKEVGYQIDHIMPIRLNGHSNRSNLQLLCPPCNWSKQGRHPVEFAQSLGLLL